MLSTIATIAVCVLGVAALLGTLWHFWDTIVYWLTWAQDMSGQLLEFLPAWLLPFAGVAVVLALVGLGVKLL